MTRLRIEDNQRVLFWDIVPSAVFVSGGFFLFELVSWLIIGVFFYFPRTLLGGPWSEDLAAFLDWPRVFAAFLGLGILVGLFWMMYLVFTYLTRTQWIEIGERLAYHQRGGTQSLDWSDVEALYFSHRIDCPYSDDASTVHYFLRTRFVVDLRDGSSRSVSVWEWELHEARTRLLHTLTANLRAGDVSKRLSAVRVLERFRPDQISTGRFSDLEHPKEWDEPLDSAKDHLQASKAMLEVTDSELERAMRDIDEEVRNAASEAFDRTRSNLNLTSGPC
jgi:hypothetical protein